MRFGVQATRDETSFTVGYLQGVQEGEALQCHYNNLRWTGAPVETALHPNGRGKGAMRFTDYVHDMKCQNACYPTGKTGCEPHL